MGTTCQLYCFTLSWFNKNFLTRSNKVFSYKNYLFTLLFFTGSWLCVQLFLSIFNAPLHSGKLCRTWNSLYNIWRNLWNILTYVKAYTYKAYPILYPLRHKMQCEDIFYRTIKVDAKRANRYMLHKHVRSHNFSTYADLCYSRETKPKAIELLSLTLQSYKINKGLLHCTAIPLLCLLWQLF